MSLLTPLLRLPGRSCPPAALTGDDVLDEYIRELDSRLLGSKYVRLLTLAEIKDHLLEAKARGISQGLDERSAAEAAVSALGPADTYAGEQRSVLFARSWKVPLLVAIPFGIIMGAYYFMAQFPNPVSSAIMSALPCGLGLAAGVFVWPARWLGSSWLPGGASEPAFEVAHSRPVFAAHLAIWILSPAAALFAAAIGVTGILKPSSQARTLVPWWLLPIFLVWLAMVVYALLREPRSFQVRPLGFYATNWAGVETFVPWQSVVGIVRPRTIVWLSFAWAGTRIEYLASNGRKRRIKVRQDMLNADRFLHLAEEYAQKNSSGNVAARV